MATSSCEHDKIYNNPDPVDPPRWPWVCQRCGRKGKDVAVPPDPGKIHPQLFWQLIEAFRPG
jgi:hypothetical protein